MIRIFPYAFLLQDKLDISTTASNHFIFSSSLYNLWHFWTFHVELWEGKAKVSVTIYSKTFKFFIKGIYHRHFYRFFMAWHIRIRILSADFLHARWNTPIELNLSYFQKTERIFFIHVCLRRILFQEWREILLFLVTHMWTCFRFRRFAGYL